MGPSRPRVVERPDRVMSQDLSRTINFRFTYFFPEISPDFEDFHLSIVTLWLTASETTALLRALDWYGNDHLPAGYQSVPIIITCAATVTGATVVHKVAATISGNFLVPTSVLRYSRLPQNLRFTKIFQLLPTQTSVMAKIAAGN